MHQLVGYHRPKSIADATGLLNGPDRLALAGGTTIRHDGGGNPVELIDLQALGLGGISTSGFTLKSAQWQHFRPWSTVTSFPT